jgi:hypothetical protein
MNKIHIIINPHLDLHYKNREYVNNAFQTIWHLPNMHQYGKLMLSKRTKCHMPELTGCVIAAFKDSNFCL